MTTIRFSIITPSLNQATYIEEAICSVRDQCRPGVFIEHIIMDGGSTDGTEEVIRRITHKAEGYMLQFLSEPDKGQSDALNKGFRRASGDIFGWLNADDMYRPGAISTVVEVMTEPTAWCFGVCRIIDEQGQEIRRSIKKYKTYLSRRYSQRSLLRANYIPQPAVFFRKSAWQKAGELDMNYHLAMDYDYWLRLAAIGKPVFIDEEIADFRWHSSSKSGKRYAEAATEAFGIARRHARGNFPLTIARHWLHSVRLRLIYSVLDWLR